MFRISNGSLFIVDNMRQPLYPANFRIDETMVFHFFSTSVVKRLLEEGTSSITYIELRNNQILTLTNGAYTMEVSEICPPICL